MSKTERKIRLPGIPFDVFVDEDEECAKAEHFVALPKALYDEHPHRFPEGTHGGYFCMYCGVECVLAPSGQKIVVMREVKLGGTKVTCTECMRQQLVEKEA